MGSRLRYAVLGSPTALVGLAALLAAASALAMGCNPSPPEQQDSQPAASYDPDWSAVRPRPSGSLKYRTAPAPTRRAIHAQPVASVQPSPDDPLAGRWSLTEALSGLPAGNHLLATIRTSMGPLDCELWPDKAPLTVANFVGLARGLRPYRTPDGTWQKRPAYDGTLFHRVLKGFVIQGGSPTGRRTGGPGYTIPDEIWEGANHDRPGLLCSATTGKNTGGMQFFITDGPALHLDGGYPIFGSCAPVELIRRIAQVEVRRGRPKRPVTIESVTIARTAQAPAAARPSSRPSASSPPPATAP